MRRRAVAGLVVGLIALAGAPTAQGGPTAGGFTSDNVEYISHWPIDAGTTTGVRVIGKYMYLTSWRHFSIYDVSDPINPQLQSTVPFGFKFENEDVSTNGKIMLFAESLPGNNLYVWDVEDKSNPVQLAVLPGAGDHTITCILDCTWAYGSDGSVVDLRDPAKPKKVSLDWRQAVGLIGDNHDVEEVKNGFILTSPISDSFQYIDVRNPLRPKPLARGAHPAPGQWLFHSGHWPRKAKDDFIIMEGEGDNGPLLTYDATNWRENKSFSLIDSYTVESGTYTDGRARSSGESSHWFQEHPDFNNGGLVVAGWYSHGARFLEVSSKGKIKEVGYFLPYAANTFASYWITDEIVYNIDLNRGIDILRWKD